MINILNFLLISERTEDQLTFELVDKWLVTGNNYDRLQAQCEKIWSQSSTNPHYDVERAFRVLSKRFAEVCHLELQTN